MQVELSASQVYPGQQSASAQSPSSSMQPSGMATHPSGWHDRPSQQSLLSQFCPSTPHDGTVPGPEPGPDADVSEADEVAVSDEDDPSSPVEPGSPLVPVALPCVSDDSSSSHAGKHSRPTTAHRHPIINARCISPHRCTPTSEPSPGCDAEAHTSHAHTQAGTLGSHAPKPRPPPGVLPQGTPTSTEVVESVPISLGSNARERCIRGQ